LPIQHLFLQRAKRTSGCAGLTCGRAYGAGSIGATANVEFRWFILIEPTPQPRAAALHDSGVMNTAEVNPTRHATLAAGIPELCQTSFVITKTTAEGVAGLHDSGVGKTQPKVTRPIKQSPAAWDPELCYTSFRHTKTTAEALVHDSRWGIVLFRD